MSEKHARYDASGGYVSFSTDKRLLWLFSMKPPRAIDTSDTTFALVDTQTFPAHKLGYIKFQVPWNPVYAAPAEDWMDDCGRLDGGDYVQYGVPTMTR